MEEMIRLKSGGATADIQLRGGEIASWRTPGGREIIWQADPAIWGQHAPILFPVCGAVKNGRIRIAGKEYPMAKHGFTRNAPFLPVRRGEDFVELVLVPTEESRSSYPFDYELRLIYTLEPDRLDARFVVENRSKETMPFCIGGHPAFVCPMEEGAAFEDYALEFPEEEDGWNALAPGGGCLDGGETLVCLAQEGRIPLRHRWFDEKDALVLTRVKSRSVWLLNRNSGRGLRMDYPKMEVLAVWSKPGAGADYVCLEPWHGMPDTVDATGNFEGKPFATLLAPGQAWQGGFRVMLIE